VIAASIFLDIFNVFLLFLNLFGPIGSDRALREHHRQRLVKIACDG
jgi:hypothetical protein